MNRRLLKRVFFGVHRFFLRFGIHVLPVHYYTPVPNIVELERTKDLWARKSEMPGISMNSENQAKHLKEVCLPFQAEFSERGFLDQAFNHNLGPGYGFIEPQALHSYVRYLKPQRIIEVGSGVSTYFMLRACQRNFAENRQATSMTSIEPFPSDELRKMPHVRLIQEQVQQVRMEEFTSLGEGDFLFIDSSHTVKPCGDVNFLILEVLPRLHRGVVVHFHDIYFPYDYQRDVLQTFLHWSETSLLRAFLTHNPRARILSCLSFLHYEQPHVLKEIFPDYVRREDETGLELSTCKPFELIPGHFPSSIYIKIE